MTAEISILKKGASDMGIDLSDAALSRFEKYLGFLIEKNKVMNLTAITEPTEIIRKHFLDCLTPLTTPYFKNRSKVIDIGSGAGLPGLPIKIARPDIDVKLVDSSQKKVGFIRDMLEILGFNPNDALCLRAEDGARQPGLRENFDIVLSRAVAPLPQLIELCIPYLKVDGIFIALKRAGRSRRSRVF